MSPCVAVYEQCSVHATTVLWLCGAGLQWNGLTVANIHLHHPSFYLHHPFCWAIVRTLCKPRIRPPGGATRIRQKETLFWVLHHVNVCSMAILLFMTFAHCGCMIVILAMMLNRKVAVLLLRSFEIFLLHLRSFEVLMLHLRSLCCTWDHD